MRSINLICALVLIFSACSPKLVKVGDLNVISTRNFTTSQGDTLLASSVGQSEKYSYLIKLAAPDVREAVEKTCLSVAGGEYIRNARMYRWGDKYIVTGDVWGKPNGDRGGLKVGDSVVFKKRDSAKMKHKGKILAILIGGRVLIEYSEDEDESDKDTIEVPIEYAAKTN